MNRSSYIIVGAALASVAVLAQAQQAAAPYTSATRYSVAGQVTGTIEPDPDGAGPLGFPATRNTYGSAGTATAGLLIKTEVGQLSAWANEQVDPSAWIGFDAFQTRTFGYDEQGRKIVERVFGKDDVTLEAVIQFSHDSWDRVACKAVRMNPAAFGSLPSDACQLGGQGIYGPDRISRFTYDVYDQVVTEERAVGTALQQTYARTGWSGRNKPTSHTDAKGNRTELRYDTNGRLHKRVYPSTVFTGQVNENDFERYTYDKNGNVDVERKRNATTITHTYDANNRLIFKDLSDNTYSGDIAYGYDLRGLTRYACFGSSTTASCDTSGSGETSAFDGFGYLTSRKSRMFGTTRELTYQYDAEGNRSRITHPGGTYFTYNRDGLNRVCSLGESAAAPACNTTDPNAFLVIHYSPEGRRADITRPGGSVTSYATDNALRLDAFTQNFSGTANDLTNGFDYNPASQITHLTQSNTQYNYTEAHNRVGTYGVNGLNQYTQIDGVSVAYDLTGNLTADGAGMTYTYDMENHLVSTGGNVSSALYYDVLGRLARVTAAGTTTDFHYDGDALVGEYTGSTFTRYVHGGGVDEPLLQYNGTSVGASYRRYLHADHQGSVIAHSDNAGAVSQKNAYDPYGIPKGTNAGRFGYTGQTVIPQLGLNYYKARFYAPKLGRFLQTDPIYYKDDMNLYAYVANDPANKTDPTGEWGFAGALYGAIAGAVGGFVASGDGWKNKVVGTLSGLVAGGAVGFVAPQTSHMSGAAAGGVMAATGAVASASGQAVGSASTAALDKGVANVKLSDVKVDPVTTAAGALGAGAGGLVGRGIAGSTAKPIIGNASNNWITVQAAGTPTAAGTAVGAAVEGAIIGAGESAAPAIKEVVTDLKKMELPLNR